jgi:chemotaxis protein methyltransferase CheR
MRATSERAKRRYFREDGRDFVLDPVIQKMVSFEERNLTVHDPLFWRSLGCDIIFCRNVIMYFTPQIMREVVHCISQALLPSGFLFLGHAETLRGLSEEFHLCHTNDTFYYQRRDTSVPAIAPVVPERGHIRVAETLPAIVETTTSWIDAIQQASERIATLADYRASPRTRDVSHASVSHASVSRRGTSPIIEVAPPVAHAWDSSLILETMRQERFSDALELLCELPPVSQDEPDALLLRAVLLTNGGRLEEAERVCTRLLAIDELNAGAHYVMALCREYADDAAGATEHDQTAVYLDANFAMPHLHLGLMAKRTHDAETARRELEQALTLFVREDASRLLLFGGGFSRETLLQLCRTELRAMGDPA